MMLDGNLLPGYRDGGILEYRGFTLIEYEPRGLRIKEIADELETAEIKPCLIYDYKGGIVTDSMEAYIHMIIAHGDGLELSDRDNLTIYDSILMEREGGYHWAPVRSRTEYYVPTPEQLQQEEEDSKNNPEIIALRKKMGLKI